MIQLPNDVKVQGYKEVKPFHFEQVFYSSVHNFEGTEKDFLKAGLAYQYEQIDKFRRIVVK